jgi:hypothetical protein
VYPAGKEGYPSTEGVIEEDTKDGIVREKELESGMESPV